MKINNLRFNEVITVEAQKIELPQIQVKEDLQQNILFTCIGNYKLPSHIFEPVIDIFNDKKYYLEFFLLKPDGLVKNNLGFIRNELAGNLIFTNPTSFLNIWQKHYQEFAMKLLFVFSPLELNNSLLNDFILCDVIQNNWIKEVKEYVRKHF